MSVTTAATRCSIGTPTDSRWHLQLAQRWLANRLREEGIAFRQCKNGFLQCGDPDRLQTLADSLTAHDLVSCGQKWLRAFTPSACCVNRAQRSQLGAHGYCGTRRNENRIRVGRRMTVCPLRAGTGARTDRPGAACAE